ncbi:Aromatic ring-opening dioxygenase, catalytic subunit, LigB family [Paenibacillus sp. UNC496MF]|uniref:DODA-type extradiol aromatic ring-opening family dioxygenase n=1 Tax=Paenibacillus sp. UNC496MF TaxID=1502753 RepID=UPI0008DFAB0D|nr:class III extradiol ring-cleavage dioxygenase [Paenibacillus sp. UNC496MF]SFJ79089.1 Aromatic ring-opening dioxygenase, catalytic subunit, LigB family [Paenibacillus sp. UNC496MF]
MLPSLFICHGSPMMAVEQSAYTAFLKQTGKRWKPRAIVLFSAHWETRVATVSFAAGPLPTIYDFGGFPDELYRLTYPAPGSPDVAAEVEARFARHGIETRRDASRGLDHGAWVFLRHMYPDADIPVVTISVQPFLPAARQLAIGEALRGLGEEDILVIGSGTTVHNFGEIKWKQEHAEPWAVEFDAWIADKVTNRDAEALADYERLAPHALRAVPRPEHFVPLLLAYGSASGKTAPRVLFEGFQMGTFSLLCLEM